MRRPTRSANRPSNVAPKNMPTKPEPMTAGSASATEVELLREHGAEHAGQEDVEQIEERSDAGDDRRLAVGAESAAAG